MKYFSFSVSSIGYARSLKFLHEICDTRQNVWYLKYHLEIFVYYIFRESEWIAICLILKAQVAIYCRFSINMHYVNTSPQRIITIGFVAKCNKRAAWFNQNPFLRRREKNKSWLNLRGRINKWCGQKLKWVQTRADKETVVYRNGTQTVVRKKIMQKQFIKQTRCPDV